MGSPSLIFLFPVRVRTRAFSFVFQLGLVFFAHLLGAFQSSGPGDGLYAKAVPDGIQSPVDLLFPLPPIIWKRIINLPTS